MFGSAFTAQSNAAQITGIADENLEEWSAATWSVFGLTGVQQVRHVVEWDTAYHQSKINEVSSWISNAEARGLKVLISFGHNYGAYPSTAAYLNAVAAFRQKFPQITEYTAWNEPNHKPAGNPWSPANDPETAAGYWVNLNLVCNLPQYGPQCTVAAGDFLDPNGDGSHLNNYITKYKQQLAKSGVSPSVWAVHPYTAAESGDASKLTANFMNLTENKPIWFTEVGGMVCRPGPTGGPTGGGGMTPEQFQNQSAQRLLSLIDQYGSRIHRTYYYSLSPSWGGAGSCTGPNYVWDSDLLSADMPRPAYKTLFPHVQGPHVETGGVSEKRQDSVVLHAAVDPRGVPTNYYFEYGPSPSYGYKTPVTYAGFAAGVIHVKVPLGGLEASTPYHYRIVASNSIDTAYGVNNSFTTVYGSDRSFYADVTGDGKADLIQIPKYTGVEVRVNTGSALAAPVPWTAEAYWATYFADVTGDGKADAIAPTDTWGVLVRRSTGSGFGLTEVWSPAFGGNIGTFFADVTGDGKADAIASSSDNNAVYVRRSNGSSFGAVEKWSEVLGGDIGTYFADVTGDGKADGIASTTAWGVVVRRSNGNGLGGSEVWTEPFGGEKGTFFADVTGDGKADGIAYTPQWGTIVRRSTGNSFSGSEVWSEPYWGDYGGFVADLTGDGRAEAIAHISQWGIMARTSTGSSFTGASLWGTW